jgi:hypothetical protein
MTARGHERKHTKMDNVYAGLALTPSKVADEFSAVAHLVAS